MASFGARECVSRTSCPMLKARIPHAVTSLRPNTCVPAMSADRACCQNASCSHQTQATIATSPIGTQCALRVLISRSSQTEGEFPVLEEDDAQAGAAVEKHRASRAGADFAGKPHCICPCRPHPGNKSLHRTSLHPSMAGGLPFPRCQLVGTTPCFPVPTMMSQSSLL
ncbi:uncharacterized protein LOC144158313 isoform X3 [Haemaphysalis longicornis]